MAHFFQRFRNTEGTVNLQEVVDGVDNLIEKMNTAINLNGNENNLAGKSFLSQCRADIVAVQASSTDTLEPVSAAAAHSSPRFGK